MDILKEFKSLPILSSFSVLANRSSIRFPKYILGIGAVLTAGVFIRTSPVKRAFNEIFWIGFGYKKTNFLPAQKTKLPTIFIDIEDVLIRKRWSFRIFGYEYEVRPNAAAFLFHLSNAYEIVGVSSMPNELSEQVLSLVDPYGCIKYRMYIGDKENLDVSTTNRDIKSIIRLRKDPSPVENDLSLGSWESNSVSNDLMTVLDFLLNLKELESDDFRSALSSYKSSNFFSTYKEVQKSLYPAPRSFVFFRNPKGFEQKIENINRSRIEEYELARSYIENKLKIEKIRTIQ